MYSRFKTLMVLFVFGMLLAWPNTVQAQSELPIFCVELSEKECALLSSIRDTISQFRSVSSDVNIELILKTVLIFSPSEILKMIPAESLQQLRVDDSVAVAAAIDQQQADALLEEAISLYEIARLDEYPEFITLLDQVIAFDPENIIALLIRALAYDELGESRYAIADFSALLALDPTSVEAALLTLFPDNADAHGVHTMLLFFRAEQYWDLGEYESAEADLTIAIDVYPGVAISYPTMAQLYVIRGSVYNEMGRAVEAIPDLEQALELDPDSWTQNRAETLLAELR